MLVWGKESSEHVLECARVMEIIEKKGRESEWLAKEAYDEREELFKSLAHQK